MADSEESYMRFSITQLSLWRFPNWNALWEIDDRLRQRQSYDSSLEKIGKRYVDKYYMYL